MCILGRIWGILSSTLGGPGTRASSAQPRLPTQGSPSASTDLQGPFHPPLPRACLSGLVPREPRVPSSWAFPDSLSPLLNLPTAALVSEPPLNPVPAPPVLSISIMSSVTCGLGEGQGQLLFTNGETEAREASGCLRSLHKLREQRCEPLTAWLGSPHLKPALSTSLPRPNSPLDLCRRACTVCSVSSQAAGLAVLGTGGSPTNGRPPAEAWVGQEHGRATGEVDGAEGDSVPWMVTLPTQPLASKDHGPAETWSPRRRASRVPAAKKGVDHRGLPVLILGCSQAAPDGRGPPSIYRHHLPPPPSQGEPALQMSPVPGPPAPQGPGEGDGLEAGSAFGVAGD